MVERLEAVFDIGWISLVILFGATTLGIGMAASWFVFQPFKWLEAGLRKAVRHD